MKKRKKGILILFLTITLAVVSGGCTHPDAQPYSRTGFYFDTITEITIYDAVNASEAKALLDGCDALCLRYEAMFSRTMEGSDLFCINHAAGAEVTVDPEVVRLLEDACLYAEQTDGLVDPTVGALTALWHIGSDTDGSIPTDAEIKEALSHIDYTAISLTDTTVRLSDPEAVLDLGFLAKGYVADRLKDYLTENGISSALINLGGNVLTLGSKPDRSPFRVGVRNPQEPYGDPLMVLSLTDGTLVSSGDYERYFEHNGVRYHHLLSTETGYPAKTGLSQVTIKAPVSEEADALSTICFLFGYERACDFLLAYPDVEAVFVTTDGEIKTP